MGLGQRSAIGCRKSSFGLQAGKPVIRTGPTLCKAVTRCSEASFFGKAHWTV